MTAPLRRVLVRPPDPGALSDVPHFRGPREILHLMSLVRPLDEELALMHLPLPPTRLVQLLRER